MSLVADVMASIRSRGGREKVNKEGVSQMEELVKQAEEARVGVLQALDSRYCQLTSALRDTALFHGCLSSAINNLNALQVSIDQEVVTGVKGSVGEVGGVVRRWREVLAELDAASILLNIHTLLEQAQTAQHDHQFLTACDNLAQVDKLLEEASGKEVEGELEIIGALQEEVLVRRTQLLYTIGEVWHESVVWSEESGSSGGRSVTMLVQQHGEQDQLQQVMGALYVLGELQPRITTLARNLKKHFLQPIMRQGAQVKTSDRSDGFAITVILLPTKPEDVTATCVIRRLGQVFKSLHTALLQTTVSTGSEDSAQSTTLMQMLGKEMGQEFKELLIKDCLAEAVPYSRAQLTDYEQVKKCAENLQQALSQIGFLSAEDQSIIEYAANVDVVFSNKACAHLLERARQLMKCPLHHTVTITPLQPSGALVIQDDCGQKLEKSTMRLEKLLATNTLNLPKCQISSSVCELVELIYETMEEACSSSPQYAGRLFYTVRNILTLYCHVVPTAHAQELATLPQQAAVVHNNGMFLAHHTMLLGNQYKPRFPRALRDTTLTTVDLAQELRKMATTTFLKAMQAHRTTLISTLRESASFESIGCDGGGVGRAQQGMRQVLHKLQLLRRVWQDVLPYTVYAKAIGTLVGSVLEEVVTRVLGLEDISADAALALINLLKLLKDFAPSLFQVEGDSMRGEEEVLHRVRLWGKFTELILVLGASLRDILDRWTDGKGPLAHEFTPDEAKQLIRALFQNTDRRAQVLARIK